MISLVNVYTKHRDRGSFNPYGGSEGLEERVKYRAVDEESP
jgi:hypothetical protein